jgi:hypothetical protein
VGGDGYLYVLYNCMGGTCAARAKIADVMIAAVSNYVTAWQAWYNGSWSGVPLGGNMSTINDPVGYLGASHSTVSHSLHDGKFYMPANLALFSSPDLVHWSLVGKFLNVCADNNVWVDTVEGRNPSPDSPFYYSWFDPTHPNWNMDSGISQGAVGQPGPVIINAKIHNGQFGWGFVQTGIETP